MRKLLIIPLFFICGQLFSQIYLPVNPTIYGEKNNRQKVLQALHPPEKSDLETNTNDTSAQIFYYKTDSTFWGWSQARGFFRIGTTSTGGGMGEVDLSALYAHSTSNFDGTKVLFYNIDNVLIDSFALEYTTLYVSEDFLLTDTLDLPKTKLLSLKDSAKNSWGGTLQNVFNKELGHSVLDKNDTVDVNEQILRIDGAGGTFISSFLNGTDGGAVISQNHNQLTLGHQDNITYVGEGSVFSNATFRSNQVSLSVNNSISPTADLVKLTITKDTARISNTNSDWFRIIGNNGKIDLPAYDNTGAFYSGGTESYGLGVDFDGELVQTAPTSLILGLHTVYNEEFTGSTSTTLTLSQTYASGSIRLYKNGARLTGSDFTESSPNQIIISVPRLSGDVFITDFNY